jgi:hypothetical protein
MIDWGRIRKLLGAALGAVTATGLIALAGALGIELDPAAAVALATALVAFATWLAPANDPAAAGADEYDDTGDDPAAYRPL